MTSLLFEPSGSVSETGLGSEATVQPPVKESRPLAFQPDRWHLWQQTLQHDEDRLLRSHLLALQDAPSLLSLQSRALVRGQTLLMSACGIGNGRVRCARELLPHSDPDQQGLHGFTALMIAARQGAEPCLRLLLPVSNLDLRDQNGMSALMLAALHNHPHCVRLLLEAGASLAPSPQGVSPLMLAVNSKDSVAALLGAGDDARAIDNQGRTALLLAARGGQEEVLKMLLPLSDTQARTHRGEDAFDAALFSIKAPRWKRARTWPCVDLLCGWMQVEPMRLQAALTRAPAGSVPRLNALLERTLLEANCVSDSTQTPEPFQNAAPPIRQKTPFLRRL